MVVDRHLVVAFKGLPGCSTEPFLFFCLQNNSTLVFLPSTTKLLAVDRHSSGSSWWSSPCGSWLTSVFLAWIASQCIALITWRCYHYCWPIWMCKRLTSRRHANVLGHSQPRTVTIKLRISTQAQGDGHIFVWGESQPQAAMWTRILNTHRIIMCILYAFDSL